MSDFFGTKFDSYWMKQGERNKRASNEKQKETNLDERLQDGFDMLEEDDREEDDREEDKDLGMLTERGEDYGI